MTGFDYIINVGHHFCNPPFTQIGSEYVASIDPASDTLDVTIMKVHTGKTMTEQLMIDGYEIITPKGRVPENYREEVEKAYAEYYNSYLCKREKNVTGDTKSI
jgi:hypothetical protein